PPAIREWQPVRREDPAVDGSPAATQDGNLAKPSRFHAVLRTVRGGSVGLLERPNEHIVEPFLVAACCARLWILPLRARAGGGPTVCDCGGGRIWSGRGGRSHLHRSGRHRASRRRRWSAIQPGAKLVRPPRVSSRRRARLHWEHLSARASSAVVRHAGRSVYS